SSPARDAPGISRKPGSPLLDAIPMLIHRRQSPAVFAGQAEFLAQAADMGIDGTRADVAAKVPDVLQQRVPADDATLAPEQVAGQFVFALGQFYRLAVDAD